MNPDSCATRPAVAANDIEWAFIHGQPEIVAHVPDGEGNYTVYRLDQTAPEARYDREFVRALLRLASQRMDETEPTSAIGVSA